MRQRGRKIAASLAVIGTASRLIASSPASDPPQPPAHLGEVERKIWAHVTSEYSGSLSSYAVLASGLESHQRAREARETIERGLVDGCDGRPVASAATVSATPPCPLGFDYLGIKI